jgi:sec-independent protein translocase protein TatA
MVGLDNPLHLAILLVIILLIFGAKRLPEMGRSLGAGMRGFKESITGEASPEPATELPAGADGTAAGAAGGPDARSAA